MVLLNGVDYGEELTRDYQTRLADWVADGGGLVVTEQVFNLNGLGQLFVDAVTNHDYVLVQSLVMLVVTIFVMTNLVVDIIYAWLDPRIRYG